MPRAELEAIANWVSERATNDMPSMDVMAEELGLNELPEADKMAISMAVAGASMIAMKMAVENDTTLDQDTK